ncbi:hypothetical protein [Streptomyces sp. CA-106110]|uniref:hypothetical protein n=1 Tax=Streptomyces sp. CA-106110 TaxID=3240044 RepID=UPI003D950A95
MINELDAKINSARQDHQTSYGADTRRLVKVLRVRTLSRLGVDVRVGIGPSIAVAATASDQIGPAGGVLAIGPAYVTEWLGPLPVEALHGIGTRQATALRGVRRDLAPSVNSYATQQ